MVSVATAFASKKSLLSILDAFYTKITVFAIHIDSSVLKGSLLYQIFVDFILLSK